MKNKKLYSVEVRIIDKHTSQDDLSRTVKVIAVTADEAMKRVRLSDNKYGKEYFNGVSFISNIDKV